LQDPIRERIASNHARLGARVSDTPATLLDAEGGWSAVLRVPATLSEEDRVTRLLEEHDVLVHPGYFFDFPSEAYLVLSLLPAPEVFAEGVERIVQSLVL
jgi:aspartate/methionine/tyrosine aminotransferase